ncbi:MAG: hypothetical protein AB1540_04590 [Bdellovibrionota bacterium]
MRYFKCFLILGILGSLTVFSGCQSSQKREAETQLIPDDKKSALSSQLTQNLVQAFGEREDEVVRHYLKESIALLMASARGHTAGLGSVKVVVLETATPYIAAGIVDTIYVSVGMLEAIHYENELAFILATQIALLKEQATVRNLANLQGHELGSSLVTLPTTPIEPASDYLTKGWFQPGGLFDFGQETYLKAERTAVEIIYAAKFDPRGAVTFVQRCSINPFQQQMRALGKILPDFDSRIVQARESVAKLTPLRDPIVTSQAFEERLQSHLQVKKAKFKTKKKANAARGKS